MQRIGTLLSRLTELSEKEQEHTLIDIDLMLDYTRVVYADLLELRKNIAVHHITEPAQPMPVPPAPTSTPVATVTQQQDEEAASIPQGVENAPLQTPLPPAVKYAEVPTVDVRTYIGINDKYLYISELFGNDKAAYDKAIQQLNKFTSLAKATEWVDAELRDAYNWDEENETVQSFYGLLSSSFRSI